MNANSAYQRGYRWRNLRVIGRGRQWFVYAGIRPLTSGSVFHVMDWMTRLQVLEEKHDRS